MEDHPSLLSTICPLSHGPRTSFVSLLRRYTSLQSPWTASPDSLHPHIPSSAVSPHSLHPHIPSSVGGLPSLSTCTRPRSLLGQYHSTLRPPHSNSSLTRLFRRPVPVGPRRRRCPWSQVAMRTTPPPQPRGLSP